MLFVSALWINKIRRNKHYLKKSPSTSNAANIRIWRTF